MLVKNSALVLAAALLAACTASQPDNAPIIPTVMGVPPLAGAWGTVTPIGRGQAITVKHNWANPFEEIASLRGYDARIVRAGGAEPVNTGKARMGEAVVAWGTTPFGQITSTQTTIIDARIWACDGPRLADVHTVEGPCTAKGMGYTYGFALEQNGIGVGYSGGGVYSADTGALLGIIVQVGTDDQGRDIAYAYNIGDLLTGEVVQ